MKANTHSVHLSGLSLIISLLIIAPGGAEG
jgi:hypothetical protein